MNYKQKAEAYIRSQLPELEPQKLAFDMGTRIPSIELNHWLRVLEPYGFKIVYGAKDLIGFIPREGNRDVFFELSNGQPATEADYQAICNILGLNEEN